MAEEPEAAPKTDKLTASLKRLGEILAELGRASESGELWSDIRKTALANPVTLAGRQVTALEADVLRTLARQPRPVPRARILPRAVGLLPSLEQAGFVVVRAGFVELTARGRALGTSRAIAERHKQATIKSWQASFEKLSWL